jgi:hypothetical protein
MAVLQAPARPARIVDDLAAKQNWRRTIYDGPVLGPATPLEASWSRSNFSWGTFPCKRLNATLAASSGFDQRSMIALALSRILELSARLWKGCRQFAN